MRPAVMKQPRSWINLFFIYIAGLTLANGLVVVRVSRNWTLSSWLVNYQGGFIRRGMPGELLFWLGRFTHLSPIVYVVITYLLLYAIILWAARDLALDSSLNFWVLALILSPATFSYQVLHPRSGYNKEIIHIAALALFLYLLKKGRLTSAGVVLYLTAVMIFGTLSHEGNFFYAPYFFAALVLAGRTFAQAAKECAMPALAGAITVYFCSKHIGSEAVVAQICSSIGYRFEVPNSADICANGAMVYLIRSRDFARGETLQYIHDFSYMTVFPLFAALALAPALGESLVLAGVRFARQVSVVWVSVVVSFLGSLVLFYYAVDWGRWIYIHVISIALLLLYLDGQRAAREGVRQQVHGPMPAAQRFAAWACVLLYATTWILPTAAEPIRMGYVGRLKFLSHYSEKAAHERRPTAD